MTWSNVFNVSAKPPPDFRRELAIKPLQNEIFAMKPDPVGPVKRKALFDLAEKPCGSADVLVMFSTTTVQEDSMFYPSPARPAQFLANVGGAILIGLFFAVVGLNVASGCGQAEGQCIGPKDFTNSHPPQLAAR
jgi:hypothetical protein